MDDYWLTDSFKNELHAYMRKPISPANNACTFHDKLTGNVHPRVSTCDRIASSSWSPFLAKDAAYRRHNRVNCSVVVNI